LSFDDRFYHDPHSDLPYERDFSEWLEGSTLVSATWETSHPSLLELHNDVIIGSIARVWLKGLGRGGTAKVICRFTASDGRSDNRTWRVRVTNR
jgi:hypothetical protein